MSIISEGWNKFTFAKRAKNIRDQFIVDLTSKWNILFFVSVIVAAFFLGMCFGRRKGGMKDNIIADRSGITPFFKGVQYLISNDYDGAIEYFTEAVKIDSEAVESYVMLGNLFRSKGEIDRAIRIRQNIILRPNLEENLKLKALYDLGIDYRSGGFLNRARTTFLKILEKRPNDIDAINMLILTYEDMREWNSAYETCNRLSVITGKNYSNVLAHHMVENGKKLYEKGNYAEAAAHYEKAIKNCDACVDAYLHLGDAYADAGDWNKAIATWKHAVPKAPDFSFMILSRIDRYYEQVDDPSLFESFLSDCLLVNAGGPIYLAYAKFLFRKNELEKALFSVSKALEFLPFLHEARRIKGKILLNMGSQEQIRDDYESLVGFLEYAPSDAYVCSKCGFQIMYMMWQCPKCREWDSIHRLKVDIEAFNKRIYASKNE